MEQGLDFIIAPLVLLALGMAFMVCLCTLIKCCRGIEAQNREVASRSSVRRYPSRQPLVQNTGIREQNREQASRSSVRRNPSLQPPLQNSTSPVVVPPYPVEPRHPTPHTSGPPPAGFGANHPPYPTHTPMGMPGPYPPTTAPYPPTTAPYPPYPVGSHIGSTPYPPTADSALPPSYQEAVAQVAPSSPPPPLPPSRDGYTKQAPYNPHY